MTTREHVATSYAGISDDFPAEPFMGYGLDAKAAREVPQAGSLSLDGLWELREAADAEAKRWLDIKGELDQELQRRVLAEHPGVEDGTHEIAGDHIIVKMSFKPTYEVNEAGVQELLASDLLTPAETNELVKFEPKVDGRVANRLLKRGGQLAELIGKARFIRRRSISFEAKERN